MSEQNYELLDLAAEEKEQREREIRRAKAREERRRKQYERRLKRKIISRLLLFALVIGGALLFCYVTRYPHQKLENNVITRDLGRGPEFITDYFSTEPDLVWDSNLPKFVQKDFMLAKQKGYSIEYTFGAYKIIGRVEDGTPYIFLDSPYGSLLSFSFYERKENFSMYYSEEDDALIIYAYPSASPDQFEKLILYADPTKYPYSQTVTYDKNLPLSLGSHESLNAVRYGDYSLYFNAEDSTFYFYKDGKVVSSRKFHDKAKQVYCRRGFIETENKLIYKMYVYEKDGLPDVQCVFVASDMLMFHNKYGYSYKILYGQDINLPILQNKSGSRFFTILPNDWDIYELYGNSKDLNEYAPKCDYSLQVISLEDKFSYAEFEYSIGWKVTLNFLIDGAIFSIDLDVDGYDPSFSLTDSEITELSVQVNSYDEMWAHFEKIRETYNSHYTNSFAELLQKDY